MSDSSVVKTDASISQTFSFIEILLILLISLSVSVILTCRCFFPYSDSKLLLSLLGLNLIQTNIWVTPCQLNKRSPGDWYSKLGRFYNFLKKELQKWESGIFKLLYLIFIFIGLKLPKFWFNANVKQFWATIMAYLQLDRQQYGYFHKIWAKYYCLNANHAPGTLSWKFIRCQNPYHLQNLKILSSFQGHKNSHGQNFWNLIFFIWKGKAI